VAEPVHIEPELDLVGQRTGAVPGPGVGAQGTAAEDVARVFAACPDRLMPGASRSLLLAAALPGM
jgi:hypothetical protein